MVLYEVMTLEDYEEVHALWLQTPGMGLNAFDDSKEGLGRYILRNPSTSFVARIDKSMVGCILCGHDGRRGYIYHLAVAQTCRKQGIARELVRHSLEALHQEGIGKVAFVVFGDNEGGNAFWTHLGFMERPDLVYRNKVIADVEMGFIKIT
ncbi:GNAT family N-acetyltransferase [uncultured Sphaerochaeta sp.]|uniref:GNAT family N-acetyltransferase n=1 Tax=uncultured Sphaerochaeta sp. TaxID=886478 RepID=UPI002A0A2A03|nr:GNAT family N-acetyltransferase [uncultured Sphaerochaeta sp.]